MSREPTDWSLRPARAEDRAFLLALNEAAMREHVDAIWGWDDAEQRAFFDARFDPTDRQILEVDGQDVGVVSVVELDDEIFLAQILLLPEWQGRGIGSSVVRHVVARGATAGKPVTLRVLRTNARARALYGRLGFEAWQETETHTYMRRVSQGGGERLPTRLR